MTDCERNDWIVNIEHSAAYIAGVLGLSVVESTLYRYGVTSIEQLNSSDLSEVFGELYAIEADLRSDE